MDFTNLFRKFKKVESKLKALGLPLGNKHMCIYIHSNCDYAIQDIYHLIITLVYLNCSFR